MPKFAANLSMMFTEVPFVDRFEAAAQAGFAGVEYLFPYDFAASDLARRLKANGLTQALHNLPAGDWAGGERGIAVLPERTGEFRDGVARAVDYAGALGCAQVNCLAGIAPEDADAGRLHDTFVENVSFAAEALERAGIRLLIEPVNTRDVPGFWLSRTAQAVAILDEVGSPNLFLQHDLYHMQVMEGDLARTLEANLPRIRHVQVADNPGRHEPGTGEIAFPFLFDRLDALGYDGWVGCEYKPLTTTAEGLGWLAPPDRAA